MTDPPTTTATRRNPMPFSDQQIEDAYDAMIECALWSSSAEFYDPDEPWNKERENAPIPADEVHDESHIDPALRAEWRSDLRAFMEDNEIDLGDMDVEQIGHDFWLTRNGHGTGFWDRGLGERGRRLTEACRPYGEADPQLTYRYDEKGEPCPS